MGSGPHPQLSLLSDSLPRDLDLYLDQDLDLDDIARVGPGKGNRRVALRAQENPPPCASQPKLCLPAETQGADVRVRMCLPNTSR